MNRQDTKPTKRSRLPALLRPFFWDYDFKTLTWDDDRDLIIARVLASGTWEAITWLRVRLGDQACASGLSAVVDVVSVRASYASGS